MASADRMKVLYFCEGYTDIRFVVGLSEICDLTMLAPVWEFQTSGLADRIAESGATLRVVTIEGKRPAFQLRSFAYLLRNVRAFDVVLSQEMVRGSLNTTVAGKLLGVPVVTYLAIAPVEYYRCRRERGRIGWLEAVAGEAFIRFAIQVSGQLATTALGMGPYLRDVTGRISKRPATFGYYGVDTNIFKPVTSDERASLRERLQFPPGKFVILFPSRISHEKDPETVLRATALLRERGTDAVVMNLGGGFQDFLACARGLGLRDCEHWVIGRPAVHPMKNLCEYMQAADAVVQASLAEGSGMSPLEALACGTPVVATRIGGMAFTLPGIAQLTPRRDADAMATALRWVADNPAEARAQALDGRAYVEAEWRREKVFLDLKQVLQRAHAGSA